MFNKIFMGVDLCKIFKEMGFFNGIMQVFTHFTLSLICQIDQFLSAMSNASSFPSFKLFRLLFIIKLFVFCLKTLTQVNHKFYVNFFVIIYYWNFIFCVCTTYLTVSSNSPAQDFMVTFVHIQLIENIQWRHEENVGVVTLSHVYYILLLWRDKLIF